MHTPHDTPKPFSIAARLRSFRHAFRGIGLFLRTAHNAWVQLVILAGVIAAGVMCALTQTEWLSIALAAGLVLTAEAFNTALEIDMNLTSPEFHPYARDTKDVAAGAVLIASITAVAIGLCVFVPHLCSY